jgi:hypothetical protein
MSALLRLRPSTKLSVYEVLQELGFDLTEWATNRRGSQNKNPAVNGRAYAWSYRDGLSGQDVFMLWHENMAERDGQIVYRQNWHGLVAELERVRPVTAKRADNFLRHVSNLELGALVHVGIVEGSRSTATDDDSSRVARRMLDSESWFLSYWDPMTSTFEFTRGHPKLNDPVSLLTGEEVSQYFGGLESYISLRDDIDEIMAEDIGETERERLVAARVGQGKFRSDLLSRWQNSCAVTGSTTLAAVRASHCKPWRSATNAERLDPANGLPLLATLDALFDAGLITFLDNGLLSASAELGML